MRLPLAVESRPGARALTPSASPFHRLLAFEGSQVTFRQKDYAHGNKKRKMTVDATELLRRFVRHVLPRGFVRIRQFGFLSNGRRTALLVLARKLIGESSTTPQQAAPSSSEPREWRCPNCGSAMHIGPNLTAIQLRFRCTFFDSS